MNFKFSKHAKIRIEERGFSIPEIHRLWNSGKFICSYIDKKEKHYLMFDIESGEYYSMVVAGDSIITFLPAIHREKGIPEDFKIQAYEKAYG